MTRAWVSMGSASSRGRPGEYFSGTSACLSALFAAQEPEFALGSGLLALRWLVAGYGYEISSTDVWKAYEATTTAGRLAEVPEDRVEQQIREVVGTGGFVAEVLGRRRGLR